MSNKFAQPNIVLIMADLGWHHSFYPATVTRW